VFFDEGWLVELGGDDAMLLLVGQAVSVYFIMLHHASDQFLVNYI